MENKNTIIAVCVACLLMTMLFACTRGCSKKEKSPKPTSNISKIIKQKEQEQEREDKGLKIETSSHRSGSHGSISSSLYVQNKGTPPALLTEQDKKKMQEKVEEFRQKRAAYAEKWFKEKLEDSTLSAKAREQYLIKSNKQYIRAHVAMKHKDYKNAVKYFNEILKDEKASPVTKYFAVRSIMNCSHYLKNLDLFFKAAKIRAELIASEDLTTIGIEKNNDYSDWVTKVENALKAYQNPSYYNEAVALKIKQENIDQKSAEIMVTDDINYYSKMFKDFY